MFLKYYNYEMSMLFVVFINCMVLAHSNDKAHNYQKYQNEESLNCDCNPPKPGWIDPFDMTGGKNIMPSDNLLVQSDVDNHLVKMRLQKCEIFMRRFVNLFLHAFDNKSPAALHPTDSLRLVKLQFFVNGGDLNTLRNFGHQEESDVDIESVNNILSKIFSQNMYEDDQYSIFTSILNKLENALRKLTSSPEIMVILSVSLMLLGSILLVYRTHSFCLAFSTISLTILCASFGFTWMRLYEEREIERYYNIAAHGNVPYHCSGHSMGWYEHMYYRMFGVDCLKFYKIRDVRPMVKVTPSEVFVEVISSMIIQPASNIGTAYGNFVNNFNGKLPWYLKAISVPLSLIIPPIFVLFTLTLCLKYHISLSPWTGFRLSPNCSSSHAADQQNSAHRYVEDIYQKDNETRKNIQTLPSIVDNEEPIFFMNFPGLKKVIAGNVLTDPADKDKLVLNTENEGENLSPGSEATESAQDIKGLEAILNRVECKTIEIRKKRTKMTFTDDKEGTDTVIDKPASGDHSMSDEECKQTSFKDKTA